MWFNLIHNQYCLQHLLSLLCIQFKSKLDKDVCLKGHQKDAKAYNIRMQVTFVHMSLSYR